MIKIPALGQDLSNGSGMLVGKLPCRLPSASEVASRVADLVITHIVKDAADLAAIEDLFPGIVAAFSNSVGPGTNGTRKLQWEPRTSDTWTGDVELVISVFGDAGNVVYNGGATLRSVIVALVPKQGVVQLKIRLFDVDPDVNVNSLMRAIGTHVEYTVKRVPSLVSRAAAPANQISMPTTAPTVHVEVGDLITYIDDLGEGTAIVHKVDGDQVSCSGFLFSNPTDFAVVEKATIIAAHQLCGPNGESAVPILNEIAVQGEQLNVHVVASELLETIFSLSDTGRLQVRLEGWPIVDEVRDRLLGLLPPEPVPDPNMSPTV